MITIMRLKDRVTFDFETECQFRAWLAKQPKRCKVKRLGVKPLRKGQLDNRQLRFLGNGGDVSYCVSNGKFHK